MRKNRYRIVATIVIGGVLCFMGATMALAQGADSAIFGGSGAPFSLTPYVPGASCSGTQALTWNGSAFVCEDVLVPQAGTPGTTQTGHAHISGTWIAGQYMASAGSPATSFGSSAAVDLTFCTNTGGTGPTACTFGKDGVIDTLQGRIVLAEEASQTLAINTNTAVGTWAEGVTITNANGAGRLLAFKTGAVYTTLFDANGQVYMQVPTLQAWASNSSTAGVILKGNQADGASAVAGLIDNQTALTNPSAKLWSFRNNGVEKASVLQNGTLAVDMITNNTAAGTITIEPVRSTSGNGADLILRAGDANTSGTGANLRIEGGDGVGSNKSSGGVQISSGANTGTGAGSSINLTGNVRNVGTASDVIVSSNQVRTAGAILEVDNGAGTVKWRIDYNGKELVPVGGSADVAGRAAMTNGTVTISTTAVTASSVILLTNCAPAGTAYGLPTVTTTTAGTSFVITAKKMDASGTETNDTSTICWRIEN